MNILVITGGLSSERKISFMSARNVTLGLKQNGYKVKLYDLKQGYAKIPSLIKDFDVIFPILHGEEGEGGKLHKYLVKFNKPIVGSSNFAGFRNSWFKVLFKKFCDKNNILTPKWKIIKNQIQVMKFGFPVVLKSSSGGSSREVIIVKSKEDFKVNLLKRLLKPNIPVFAERLIHGTEVTVGILNNRALPVIKIVPPKGEWFSYKNKYSSETKEIVNPHDINQPTKHKLQKIALDIHRKFKLGSYSRIDFILENENPYVLEVNTIPGLTKESLLPKMAKAKGINFKDFVSLLVKLALRDFRQA
ncbi:MAG: hypothetical protein A2W22_01415 [Candidatus Levybacteria bacterium RBG_16_35_11]|nr:MAG: hypothetical protein A2W22_01415 [Candidatus Levybacteria bacterium RBG_16_35_11]